MILYKGTIFLSAKTLFFLPSQSWLVQFQAITLPLVGMVDMVQDSEAIDGPSGQNGVSVDAATLITVLAAHVLQLPELWYKPAIETLGGTDLEKVVALVAGSVTADIDLLDAEDVCVQLG